MIPEVIGYYDDSAHIGGTVRYLMELLGALDRQRFQPVFFAPQEREWHTDLRALDIEIITLGSSGEARPPAATAPLLSLAREVRPIMRRLRGRARRTPTRGRSYLSLALETRQLVELFGRRPVDLLHCNATGWEVAPIAARLAGIPQVLGTWHISPTSDLTGSRGALRYRLLERASMLALHRSIAVSEAVKRDWLRRCKLGRGYEDRVSVIPNGIDPRRVERRSGAVGKARYGIPEEALVIGSIGCFYLAKGHEYLIRALPQIVAAEPRAHFLVAGGGPLEAELRELAASLGVALHVHLTGFVADVREVLECLDVYVQPSLCEAQGLAVLEAMASGLPVIASAVGGLPESVDAEVTGYLVPARDPGALAQTVGRLIGDPARREEMGRQGRARVLSHFTRDRMVARTVFVYDEMLSTRPGARGARHQSRDESLVLEQTR
jgi:glycosyltransferase involved in cell wall biosynthesis